MALVLDGVESICDEFVIEVPQAPSDRVEALLLEETLNAPDKIQDLLMASVCECRESEAGPHVRAVASFIEIGRLTVADGLHRLSERLPCEHMGVVILQHELSPA